MHLYDILNQEVLQTEIRKLSLDFKSGASHHIAAFSVHKLTQRAYPEMEGLTQYREAAKQRIHEALCKEEGLGLKTADEAVRRIESAIDKAIDQQLGTQGRAR